MSQFTAEPSNGHVAAIEAQTRRARWQGRGRPRRPRPQGGARSLARSSHWFSFSPVPRPVVTWRGGGRGGSRDAAARAGGGGGGGSGNGGRCRRRALGMRWRLLWLLCAAGWWGAGGKTLRGGFASAAARLEPWRPVARFQFHGECPREGSRREVGESERPRRPCPPS